MVAVTAGAAAGGWPAWPVGTGLGTGVGARGEAAVGQAGRFAACTTGCVIGGLVVSPAVALGAAAVVGVGADRFLLFGIPEAFLPVEAAGIRQEGAIAGGVHDAPVDLLLDVHEGEVEHEFAQPVALEERQPVDQRKRLGGNDHRVVRIVDQLVVVLVAVVEEAELVALAQVAADGEELRVGEDRRYQALQRHHLGHALEGLLADLQRRNQEIGAVAEHEGRGEGVEGVQPGPGDDDIFVTLEHGQVAQVVDHEVLLALLGPVVELFLQPGHVALRQEGLQPEDQLVLFVGQLLLVAAHQLGVLAAEADDHAVRPLG